MTEKAVAKIVLKLEDVSAQELYESWLTVERVRKWMPIALQNIGLPGKVQTVEIDSKVGGEFCFSDSRPNGLAVHWGNYLELQPHSKIIFTWNAGSQIDRSIDASQSSVVSIVIKATEQGCEATLEHQMDSAWAEYVPRVEASWANMLQTIHNLKSM